MSDCAEKQFQQAQQAGQFGATAAQMQRDVPGRTASPDTVNQMLIMIRQQTGELIERTFAIGTILAGSPPPPPNAGVVAPDASNVLDQLRLISQGLALAVSHCERAQKAL